MINELEIRRNNSKMIVFCPKERVGAFGSIYQTGMIQVKNCDKCFNYKGLKNLYTLKCSYKKS